MNPERKAERLPLGSFPYRVDISRGLELSVLLRHRQLTGEPIQSTVRRLIRELGKTYEPGTTKP